MIKKTLFFLLLLLSSSSIYACFGEKELSLSNPRIEAWDSIYEDEQQRVKAIIDLENSPLYSFNEIIPSTANHGSWILGPQLSRKGLEKLRDDEKKQGRSLLRVNMLPDRENQVPEAGDDIIRRLRWFDHGILNAVTGKNQSISGMRVFQQSLYAQLSQDNKKDVYCHCMLGVSRSQFETIAFIYYYPQLNKLFDFASLEWQAVWGKIAEKYDLSIKQGKLQDKKQLSLPDLKERLSDNPSISDIAEFIHWQRPAAKTLDNLRGDQAGLLGLMALDKIANGDPNIIMSRTTTRVLQDAQNIGFCLSAPLDLAFREKEDLEDQERNFKQAYNLFQQRGIQLLMAMIVPIYMNIDPQSYKNKETFNTNFSQLSPSQQARFAILMKKLEEAGLNLEPFQYGESLHYASIAAGKVDQLTAGDEVELLKAFGPLYPLSRQDVIDKIFKKAKPFSQRERIDRFHAGIQLAELLHDISKNIFEETVFGCYIKNKSLTKEEQVELQDQLNSIKNNDLTNAEKQELLDHLKDLHDRRAARYAQITLGGQ